VRNDPLTLESSIFPANAAQVPSKTLKLSTSTGYTDALVFSVPFNGNATASLVYQSATISNLDFSFQITALNWPGLRGWSLAVRYPSIRAVISAGTIVQCDVPSPNCKRGFISAALFYADIYKYI